ncbi:uncharacterized protein LY79DRAFT_250465 [Colletotrichum navitas]|uniref:Uncharacterized protein n=1 Tax=Colletotrichum navitas TaxID=681940 RepID=A0AAD8QAJ1_9PEZI|nr:uncharacterized protein LY79DRAFT_250465 [Colletotrichum navitas]KAK1598629.1 hypothetical protein LY79DRAFT_250465 [Colletotrichum navitas]
MFFSLPEDRSPLTLSFMKQCGSLERSRGLKVDDMAALEAIGVHSALFNTIPSSSWPLVYVFNSVDLIVYLRAELKASSFSANLPTRLSLTLFAWREIPFIYHILPRNPLSQQYRNIHLPYHE